MTDEQFTEFVRTRYTALVRYGALLTADAGHGEDLAQEALIKTYRAWPRLYPDGDPEAYTRTVMARAAWRAGRRLWRREVPTAALPESSTPDGYAERDTAAMVFAALRMLPTQQRIVLVLRFWADLSERELAEMLDCSPGTVKSRASRAIAALRSAGSPLAEAADDPVAGPYRAGEAAATGGR
jgi:RNA polymerase sigma-70 factor (sigma-E family)